MTGTFEWRKKTTLGARSCEEITLISKDLSIVLLFAQGYFYLMSNDFLQQNAADLLFIDGEPSMWARPQLQA
jgi:hypothetical protein